MSTTSVAAVYFGANLTFTSIFLILSEQAYLRGVWVLSVPFFWVLGTLLFLRLYPRLRPFFQDGLTLHQALRQTFDSPALQRWASLWTIVAFVGTVSLEFYGGIRLLQWTNLPLFVDVSLALLLAFVVGFFTVSGGFRGVAAADIWLDVIALCGTILLFVYCATTWIYSPSATGAAPGPMVSSPGLIDNLLFVVAMGAIFVPFQLCTLDTWQRLGAWERRGESPRSWLLGGSVLLALAYCVPILIGMYVRSTGDQVAASSHVLRVFIEKMHIGPVLLGLVFSGFVAAIFSTADELLNCCGLSLLFDAFQIPRVKKERSDAEEGRIVVAGQFYTTAFGFVAAMIALLALRFDRLISDISLAIFSGQVVFTFPLFAAIFVPKLCPRLKGAAVYSMIAAFAVAVCSVFAGWILNDRVFCDAAPLLAAGVGGVVFGLPFFYVYFRYRRHQ